MTGGPFQRRRLDDLDRDTIALIIAGLEDDDDATLAILNAYRSDEALTMLVLNLAQAACQGIGETVAWTLGLGPDDEVPADAVTGVLRRYLAQAASS
jgi:hypothetical protein